MENFYKPITAALIGVSGWISAKLGILAPLLYCFCALMIIDYFSGMMAAAAEAIDHPDDDKYGWSSKKGMMGILKKMSHIIMIASCMIADYVILLGIDAMGWKTPVNGIFAILITLWYILNELLSIFENAKRMHAPVPGWAIKYIAVMRNSIDHKFDYMDDEEEKDEDRDDQQDKK